VVGVVLEAVTHKPLADALAADVFTPAGLTATRLVASGEKPAGRSGYFADGRDDRFIDIGRFGAAGAVAGPAADLARFDRALMTDKLLKPASRAEMERGDPKLGYAALGVWSYTVPLHGCARPVRLVERRGEIGGVQVRNVIAPDAGLALVVFTDRPFEFGEAWQGKGGSFDLFSAAFCPETAR
ncbi:MAG: serine hydrolase, partial [Sphingomonadaceae bacterium]|nr:serine hydrolase [Sphingomonadaceae bacterium]